MDSKQYNPVSEIGALLPQEAAGYATYISDRKPKTKYHEKGHARQALDLRIGRKWDRNVGGYGREFYMLSGMKLYKYDRNTQRYYLIWDSDSELADACKMGIMTPKEMFDLVAW